MSYIEEKLETLQEEKEELKAFQKWDKERRLVLRIRHIMLSPDGGVDEDIPQKKQLVIGANENRLIEWSRHECRCVNG